MHVETHNNMWSGRPELYTIHFITPCSAVRIHGFIETSGSFSTVCRDSVQCELYIWLINHKTNIKHHDHIKFLYHVDASVYHTFSFPPHDLALCCESASFLFLFFFFNNLMVLIICHLGVLKSPEETLTLHPGPTVKQQQNMSIFELPDSNLQAVAKIWAYYISPLNIGFICNS